MTADEGRQRRVRATAGACARPPASAVRAPARRPLGCSGPSIEESAVPVRVGVHIQPQQCHFVAMRRAWREADELGVDTIFCWDHFYPLYGEPDGKHFEALTTMASMAEVTERAQIGALVICNSYRTPELLADAHRTVDHISGGRVILGIGAGWFQRDYDEYGYEFGEARDRLAQLKADLPRIRARLAKLNPAPVGSMPILIGGSGPKGTVALLGEAAGHWDSLGR